MSHITTAVIVLKTLTLLLGGSITYLALKAYRRTGSKSLQALSLGFGFVTLGALAAGISDQIIQMPTGTVLAIESALTTVGFAVIVYSLYTE